MLSDLENPLSVVSSTEPCTLLGSVNENATEASQTQLSTSSKPKLVRSRSRSQSRSSKQDETAELVQMRKRVKELIDSANSSNQSLRATSQVMTTLCVGLQEQNNRFVMLKVWNGVTFIVLFVLLAVTLSAVKQNCGNQN